MADKLIEFYMQEVGVNTSRQLGYTLRRQQKKYSAIGEVACKGLKQMGGSKYTPYCRDPLCPTCYFLALRKAYEFILRATGWEEYYVRATGWYGWGEDIPEKLIKRFKGAQTSYRLIAHIIDFSAAAQVIDTETARADPFNGELIYRKIGVFGADHSLRRVRDRSRLAPGLIDVRVGDHYEQLEQEQFTSASDALDNLLSKLHVPSKYMTHGDALYTRYVERFSEMLGGKHWSSVGRIRKGDYDKQD